MVVLQRTAKKCTKICIARAKSLFCYLNLLFSYVLVSRRRRVCLSSLIARGRRRGTLYPIGHEHSLSHRLRTWSHTHEEFLFCVHIVFLDFNFLVHTLKHVAILFTIFSLLYSTCLRVAMFLSASPCSLSQLARKRS